MRQGIQLEWRLMLVWLLNGPWMTIVEVGMFVRTNGITSRESLDLVLCSRYDDDDDDVWFTHWNVKLVRV
ncbi:unnamed protein product [Ambrosiozyma monospora]|uniref:Unnamed protein product n=1 Tax=Ambrosiozyma monospora TaxID=43982 RepID=A0ACB5U0X4_AMBMO|nr:unnamed protein product [Ambrosiozyma monospora]